MAASSFQESSGCDLQLYECGRLRFAGSDNYDRHLVFPHAATLEDTSSQRERFERIARTARDSLSQRWQSPSRFTKPTMPGAVLLVEGVRPRRTLVSNLVKLGGQHL